MKNNSRPKLADFRLQKAASRYEGQMQALWAECFPEDKDTGFIPFFFANVYEARRTYLAIYEGRLAAMLYAPLIRYHLGGKAWEIPYIQGVAVAPIYRRLGLANRLLAAAQNDLAGQGFPFAVLKPFNVDFYAKSGWRVFAYSARLPLAEAIQALPAPDCLPSEGLSVCELNAGSLDYDGLAAVFEGFQQRLGNAYPLRSKRNWQLLLQDHFNDGGRLFAAVVKDKLLAYSQWLEQEDKISLGEAAYSDENAFRLLLEELQKNAIAAKKQALLHLPTNHKLCRRAKIEPFAMLRILNASTLLSSLPLFAPTALSTTLQLRDSIIKSNNKRLLLPITRRAEGGTKNLTSEAAEITIEELTERLARWYNFRGTRGEDLAKQAHAPTGTSYFNEFF